MNAINQTNNGDNSDLTRNLPYPEKSALVGYEVNELISRRWSTRAFDENRPVERHKILSLLEAARWAPSCFNEQPWRYLVFDNSNVEALHRARACLIGFNSWAHKAPVLMLSVARDSFTSNGNPNRHAQHDVGLASQNLVLEAVHQGLAAHQMGGFDIERARREFNIPKGFMPMAMMAIGYAYRGQPDELPGMLRSMETEARQRRAIREIAFAGKWSQPYEKL